MENVLIRRADGSEQKQLEDLQLRASLTNAGDREALLAHPDAIDLRERQLDGIRVGEQGFTITGVGKRCPQLQILTLLLLRDNRPANQKLCPLRPTPSRN